MRLIMRKKLSLFNLQNLKQAVGEFAVKSGYFVIKLGISMAFKWDLPRKKYFQIALQRNWDFPKFYEILGEKIDSKTIIVIVGAHHGETAIQYLDSISESIVVAFEPNLISFEIAQVRLERYGDRVKLINKSVGSEFGHATLWHYADSATDSIRRLQNEEALGKSHSVLTSLDSEDTINFPKIHLLQIDVQGYEMEVIKGMSRHLAEKRIETILIEGNFEDFYSEQSSFWEIAHELSKTHKFLGFASVKFAERIKPDLMWVDALFIRRDLLT